MDAAYDHVSLSHRTKRVCWKGEVLVEEEDGNMDSGEVEAEVRYILLGYSAVQVKVRAALSELGESECENEL
jgi:hypothetical protein